MRYLILTIAFFIFLSFFVLYSSTPPVRAQIPQTRIISSVQVRETSEAVVVTINEAPLRTYVTRQFDERFQLIIPRAGASLSPGNIYSGKFVVVQAERRENDAAFSFDLSPGSKVALKPYSDKLEVLILPPPPPPPGGSNNLQANKAEAFLTTPDDSKTEIRNNPETFQPKKPITVNNSSAAAAAAVTGKLPLGPNNIFGGDLNSQSDTPKTNESGLRIKRVSRRPLLNDFINNETGQRRGAEITDFRQLAPDDGAPVSQSTRAYLSYDNSSLYVVFVCRDEPGKIRAHMAKREDILGDDVVTLILDTFHDRRRAYMFSANPLGVQSDGITTEGQGSDETFDTVWHTEGRLMPDGRGYAVLMEIPFKSLRFSNAPVQSWGIALGRTIAHKNEEAYYPHITQSKQGYIQQAATLEGLEKISPGRNIQIIPYYVASSERSLDVAPNGVPSYRKRTDVRAGADAKIVFKNAFTLDLTVNPDFSQVESDEPQVTVNRRFETYFPEKRPFFIENAAFFQTPEDLFFSRRIIDPQFGARLTGKMGNWAIGGLLIDDKAPGRFFAESEPEFGRRAFIGAFRLQREFSEQSTAGFFVTNYKFGDETNRVISFDTRLRLNDNWSFAGQAVRSYSAQKNAGFSTTGAAYLASLSRNGRNFNYDITYTDRSPGFRASLGFIPRVDIRQIEQSASYYWRPNKKGIVGFGPSAYVSGNWDRTGRLQDWYLNSGFKVDFTGLTGVDLNRSKSYEFFAGQGFHTDRTTVYFYSDRLSWLGINGAYGWGSSINYSTPLNLNPFVARSSSGNLTLSIRPNSQFRVQQTYIYSHLRTNPETDFLETAKPVNIYYNHILRTKLSYQFNRRLSLRAIVDYNGVLPNQTLIELEREKRFTTDLLLTYMINPGTAVYVGYTDLYENLLIGSNTPARLMRVGSPFNPTGRRFFIKVNNLFRF